MQGTIITTTILNIQQFPLISTVYPLISAGIQTSAASLGIHTEISASPLISAAPLNATLLK